MVLFCCCFLFSLVTFNLFRSRRRSSAGGAAGGGGSGGQPPAFHSRTVSGGTSGEELTRPSSSISSWGGVPGSGSAGMGSAGGGGGGGSWNNRCVVRIKARPESGLRVSEAPGTRHGTAVMDGMWGSDNDAR